MTEVPIYVGHDVHSHIIIVSHCNFLQGQENFTASQKISISKNDNNIIIINFYGMEKTFTLSWDEKFTYSLSVYYIIIIHNIIIYLCQQ